MGDLSLGGPLSETHGPPPGTPGGYLTLPGSGRHIQNPHGRCRAAGRRREPGPLRRFPSTYQEKTI